ncbi:serine/threonine-protein kinase NIM1-like [Gigantopelta aegis]|uniref:serine/threonine-protein kinase NIM1-like n=1 Tax=Gigantopelta aegis TaxID=1735272 RepID=UPI001B889A17|nr:serine/threonine-protein kinase NIM1-like [Gigantopelta aegis]
MTTLTQIVNEIYVPADQPKVIGNYLLDTVIGEGRFACVRAGIHQLAQGQVAVKTLSKFCASRGDTQRCLFFQESKSLRRLQHWNIVRLYETMETKNTYYLVLEVIPGMSLSTLLNKRGTLPENEAQLLIGQLASGVLYMTKSGIVHRSVYFGLSASCVAGQHLRDQCGTPMYAAPEIFGKQPYTGAVDVWSMGVVLCEMVTGIFHMFTDVFRGVVLCGMVTGVLFYVRW